MARRKRSFIGEDGREYEARLKKPFYKKWWFWLIVFVVFFGLFSESEDERDARLAEEIDDTEIVEDVEDVEADETEDVAEDEPEDEPEEEVETVVGIGETIAVGNVEYTVNGIDTASNVGGDWGENAQGTFLIIDLTVKNNGNEALRVYDEFFTLLNDGKEFEADGTAGIYANDDDSFFIASINPDLSMTGKVVFDVSETVLNSETKQLQVQTGVWGTETGLINLK